MNRGIIGVVVALIVILIIAGGSWYTATNRTRRPLAQRRGDRHRQPGLGFKVPLFDSVEKVSVKTSTYTWDKMNSYSFDQQPADLKVSVTLRAAPEKVADSTPSSAGSMPRSTRWSAPSSTSRSRSCSAAILR